MKRHDTALDQLDQLAELAGNGNVRGPRAARRLAERAMVASLRAGSTASTSAPARRAVAQPDAPEDRDP